MVRVIITEYSTEVNQEKEYILKPKDFDNIYDLMMLITEGDHEISSEVASWCELATVGEIYEFREGIAKIVDYN